MNPSPIPSPACVQVTIRADDGDRVEVRTMYIGTFGQDSGHTLWRLRPTASEVRNSCLYLY